VLLRRSSPSKRHTHSYSLSHPRGHAPPGRGRHCESGTSEGTRLSDVHFRGQSIRQVRCYTFLSGCQLPWPPSCCPYRPTPFRFPMCRSVWRKRRHAAVNYHHRHARKSLRQTASGPGHLTLRYSQVRRGRVKVNHRARCRGEVHGRRTPARHAESRTSSHTRLAVHLHAHQPAPRQRAGRERDMTRGLLGRAEQTFARIRGAGMYGHGPHARGRV